MFMLKTTVLLREDVYEYLIRTFGKRNISKAINGYFVEHLFRGKKKDFFGADAWLQKSGTAGLRDHHEHKL